MRDYSGLRWVCQSQTLCNSALILKARLNQVLYPTAQSLAELKQGNSCRIVDISLTLFKQLYLTQSYPGSRSELRLCETAYLSADFQPGLRVCFFYKLIHTIGELTYIHFVKYRIHLNYAGERNRRKDIGKRTG